MSTKCQTYIKIIWYVQSDSAGVCGLTWLQCLCVSRTSSNRFNLLWSPVRITDPSTVYHLLLSTIISLAWRCRLILARSCYWSPDSSAAQINLKSRLANPLKRFGISINLMLQHSNLIRHAMTDIENQLPHVPNVSSMWDAVNSQEDCERFSNVGDVVLGFT